jgi:hypothetical protein
VNEEDQTAAQQGDSGRKGPEPLIVGISDGVNAGYEALEYVLAGLRESIRIRRPTWMSRAQDQAGGGARAAGGEASPLEFDYLVRMLADLLGSASAVAQEFARYIGERTGQQAQPEAPAPVALEGVAGERASGEFRVHNTGSTALQEVQFVATKLIGGNGRIEARLVEFEPEKIASIRPGGSITTKVTVPLAADTPPETYHGLIQAQPVGAWAVLELNVRPKKVEPATAS